MDCSPPGFSVHGILQAEHWNGLPCPPPGNLPHPGIELVSPASLIHVADEFHWPWSKEEFNSQIISLSLLFF